MSTRWQNPNRGKDLHHGAGGEAHWRQPRNPACLDCRPEGLSSGARSIRSHHRQAMDRIGHRPAAARQAAPLPREYGASEGVPREEVNQTDRRIAFDYTAALTTDRAKEAR